jgi:hypothetical protein
LILDLVSYDPNMMIFKIGQGRNACQAVLIEDIVKIGDISYPGYEGTCFLGNYTAETGVKENINNGQ